ncbi:type II toxin-antitoxin system VapC family toxin [Cytophagales bacterium LB-30]|uniref:Type II toxin-antitoxin system VapC family toxin n=1 Tax=Shiella aurantiaca TaxID=3058365 RepID=A0ABT8F4R2_9BACT|nr:type II toxin-antitoxin system VapC family toxin [Shiella aurantiaca]MDN4165445.1 type II toxin-antitoxin system VapC family toxin [Shiella aurantiaca]
MDFKRLTLYVDTSVLGGYFDIEFAKETQKLFDNLSESKYDIMYSSVTEDELLYAPEPVQELLNQIPQKLKRRVELTEEAVQLADTYIKEKVVGKTSREDCFHIALATIHKADVLVSWNFKHIVNIFRIRGYNAVNLKLGYAQIDIRSPKDIIDNEEE